MEGICLNQYVELYADGCKCKTPHINEDEYEKRYAELTVRYEKAKAKYDDIAEQIESKKAKRELFNGFIRTLEKQDGLIKEFDAGIWSSLVQEVIVKAKDDIRFIFKNGFEVRVQKQDLMALGQKCLGAFFDGKIR